eukprot:gene16932-23242_t
MSFPIKKKKIPPIRKSLSFFLLSLQGMEVAVEMKNDLTATGILEHVDASMNISMVEVKLTHADHDSKSSSAEEHEYYDIQGPMIRYVHLPRSLKASNHLAEYIKKTDRLHSAQQPHMIIDRTKTEKRNAVFKSEETEEDNINPKRKKVSNLTTDEIVMEGPSYHRGKAFVNKDDF